MSQTKFTPGPWHSEADWAIVDDSGFEVAYAEASEHHKSNAEAHANACLIAASPELYEVLERYVLADSNVDELKTTAQVALAKARGEHS